MNKLYRWWDRFKRNRRADKRKKNNQCCICGKDLAGKCYLLRGHLNGRLVGRCCYVKPIKEIIEFGEIKTTGE